MVRTIKNYKIKIVAARSFDCELSKSFDLVGTPGLFLKEITMPEPEFYKDRFCRECASCKAKPLLISRCTHPDSHCYDDFVFYSQQACRLFLPKDYKLTKGGSRFAEL